MGYKKKIGLFGAVAVVVANMIGTGVFTALGFQAINLPSAPVLLIVWFLGGLIALCGGLSYIQLARLYPDSGGEYNYIRRGYHKSVGYLAGIVSVLAGFAAPVALASMAFSAYLSVLFPEISQKWTAFALLSFVTLFHSISLRTGERFQLVTTALKILLVLIFIYFGLKVAGNANKFTFEPQQFSLLMKPDFARALVYVSFAYSGWNACVYIFLEIRNPQKNIKRSILIGTLGVICLYILLNYVFLRTVPMNNISGTIDIGAVSAQFIFGDMGGRLVAGLISLLLVSSVSAMVWVGPRVIQKMMKNNGLPMKLSKNVPVESIIIQYLVTCFLLFSGTFEDILTFSGILMILSSVMAVLLLFRKSAKISAIKLLPAVIFLLVNGYALALLFYDLYEDFLGDYVRNMIK